MADPVVTHSFQSAKADGVDPTKVQPSHWNADHSIQQEPGLIGRSDPGVGPATVIHPGAGLTLNAGVLDVAPTVTNIPPNRILGNSSSVFQPAVPLAPTDAAYVLQGTANDFRGNSPYSLMGSSTLWNAASIVTLPYAATIQPNFATGINFGVSMGGNMGIANPLNAKQGQSGLILMAPTVGGISIFFDTAYKFPQGAIRTASGGLDVLFYYVYVPEIILCSLVRNYT
jgi:hypothetical protein